MSERVTEERHGYRGGPGVPPGPPSVWGLRGPFEAPFQMKRAISGPPTKR